MKKVMVTLSEREEKRFWVLNKVLAGDLSISEAAISLGASYRHVKRLKAAVLKEGLAALAHGNRGRKPAHAIPPGVTERIMVLAQTTYRGCNDTFLSELLAEHEGIHVSASSVRRILRAAGIPSPRKHRPPKPHPRRQRKPQVGMLVQIDGSQHNWLEDRGPRLALLAAIDDATSQILAAVFRPTEDFIGYCLLMEQLLTHHGLPLRLYSDRHTIFFSPKRDSYGIEQELAGQAQPLSQFGRILSELQIEHIPARSPQAKGRVERLFETLQGRLPVLLRLAGVTTIEQANAYLAEYIPRFNQQFAVAPASSICMFRPLPSHLQLAHVLCWKEPRTLQPGHTVSWDGLTWRVIPPGRDRYIPVRSTVMVHRHHDEQISVSWGGLIYPIEPLLDKPSVPVTKTKDDPQPPAKSKSHNPSASHPWRKSFKDWNPRGGVAD